MPQVPYNPVPEVTPADRPIPTIQPRGATEAAFGGGIGAATREFGGQRIGLGERLREKGKEIERLGGAEAGLGEKLAQSAETFQHLNNETWAKDNDVKVMMEIGKAKADFDQLEGQNAVNALPAFQEQIKGIREKYISAAPNPDAKNMLDQSVARRVGFAIVDAGSRAGTQAKAAADKVSKDRLDAAVDAVDIHDKNNISYNLKVIRDETIAQFEHKIAKIEGAKPDVKEAVEQEIRRNQARAMGKAISTGAYNDPELARETYEQYKGHMDPDVREKALNAVMRGEAGTESRVIAQRITKDFDPSKGPGQLTDLLERGKKATEDSDNPYLKDNTESHIRGTVNLGMAAYNDAQRYNMDKVTKSVLGSAYEKQVMDMDAIHKNPELEAAFQALSGPNQKAVVNWVTGHKKQFEKPTAEQDNNFSKLLGLSRTNKEQFLGTNLLSENLTDAQVRKLDERKDAILGKSEDQSFEHYYTSVRSRIRNAGVEANSDEELLIKGRLEQAIENYKAAYPGADPKYKELNDMATQLLTQQPGGPRRGFLYTQGTPRYQIEIPPGNYQSLAAALRAKGVPDTVANIYDQFTKLLNAGKIKMGPSGEYEEVK